ARRSDQCDNCRVYIEGRRRGCSCRRVTNAGFQRHHQPRDRCGLREPYARADRYAFRAGRCLLRRSACPISPLSYAACDPSDISVSWLCGSRRAYELRSEPDGCLSSDRCLRRPHSQRCEAGRAAGRAVDQVRAGHQRAGSQGAWSHRAAGTARPRRRGDRMIGRRGFITLLGGAAAWPLAARAQQATKLRRIGVLQALAADDAESSRRFTAFVQGLQELGWAEGRNMRIDVRWGGGDAGRIRDYAAELVALAPDVIFVIGAGPLASLQRATRTVPIVFALVSDPVGAGLVESLARPGGNITGFGYFEFSTGGKWVELLKEMAPRGTRMAVVRDPALAAGVRYFTAGPPPPPPPGGE